MDTHSVDALAVPAKAPTSSVVPEVLVVLVALVPAVAGVLTHMELRLKSLATKRPAGTLSGASTALPPCAITQW